MVFEIISSTVRVIVGEIISLTVLLMIRAYRFLSQTILGSLWDGSILWISQYWEKTSKSLTVLGEHGLFVDGMIRSCAADFAN